MFVEYKTNILVLRRLLKVSLWIISKYMSMKEREREREWESKKTVDNE